MVLNDYIQRQAAVADPEIPFRGAMTNLSDTNVPEKIYNLKNRKIAKFRGGQGKKAYVRH